VKGQTKIFFAAIESGDLDALKAVLEEKPAVAQQRDEYARTGLLAAVRKGRLNCVEMLLRHCDANEDGEYGTTPLMEAAREGAIELVRALTPRSDLGLKDEDGWTALDWATDGEHWECADLLAANMSDAHAEALTQKTDERHLPWCRARLERKNLGAALDQNEDRGENVSTSASPSKEPRAIRRV
jgi:ankyrin repeat protein